MHLKKQTVMHEYDTAYSSDTIDENDKLSFINDNLKSNLFKRICERYLCCVLRKKQAGIIMFEYVLTLRYSMH